jgi:hypothetical protein
VVHFCSAPTENFCSALDTEERKMEIPATIRSGPKMEIQDECEHGVLTHVVPKRSRAPETLATGTAAINNTVPGV